MKKLIGISGSLRRASYNTSLLHAAKTLAPADCAFDAHTLHGIPLYDGDLEETEGIPPAVTALAAAISAADGVLLVTPEYNKSIPGVFKNAIDWLSRVEGDIFAGKPVALIGATPGGFGTINSQNAWLPVLRTLETKPYFGGWLLVAGAPKLIDPTGVLTDETTRKRLADFLAGFASTL